MQAFRIRSSLLVSVSSLALIVAGPNVATAEDLPARPAIVIKPTPGLKNEWTWWLEGGAAHLNGGDSSIAGLNNPPLSVASKPWGWEAAAGFDYRLDNTWHLSGQFRYGQNKTASKANNPLAIFNIVTTAPTPIYTPTAVRGNNSAQRKESHWLADFMVGRELGLGQGLPSVARFGVRVAEIRGKTNGSAQWNNVALAGRFATTCTIAPTPGVCGTHKRDYTQQNSFFGAGPRIELDGSIPLAPRWSIDYMGGLAGLYGRRTAIQTVNVSQTVGSAPPNLVAPTCVAGCPVNAGVTDNAWIANADAMVGLSYALTSNVKASLSYRFDGYWNALKAFNSNGQETNLNRFYQGAMLRLTMNGDSVEAAPPDLIRPSSIKNEWTLWVEGGAVHLNSGTTGVAGLNSPGFDVAAKSSGWEGALGFDYRLDNAWHLSSQFRYGQNKATSKSSNPLAVFNIVTVAPTPIFTPTAIRGTNVAQHKESHWLADFMVGRELGLGRGLPSIARFGVRVAEIRSKTTGSAQWNNIPAASTFITTCTVAPTPGVCLTHNRNYTQQNSFFGAGPRLELDGSIPLVARWSIDYMGGIAALYGRRSAVQTVNVSQSAGTLPASFVFPVCAAGCPVNANYSDNALVPNADAMVGLSYAITDNLKATVSYRFDGYWDALKSFDSNGQVTNLNRLYQGAMLRLSVTN
jgi:opacity protein-like surface antigen